MEYLEAKVVDENHLKLVRRIDMPAGSRVMVSVVRLEDAENENEVWQQLGAECLAEAYDETEPEYSIKLIKRHNPEFRP